ncbi:MAG: hypothetical protein OXN17_15230 [Candidatus Poribacteria bacterium]|nr:hypothetical protein [Candidatus Poribacteria bacterium]
MQSSTKEWIIQTVVQLAEPEAKQLKDYLEFLTWKSRKKPKPENGQNLIAQRLIEAMESPPHLSHKDVEVFRQSIEEGKMPVNSTSPLEPEKGEKS